MKGVIHFKKKGTLESLQTMMLENKMTDYITIKDNIIYVYGYLDQSKQHTGIIAVFDKNQYDVVTIDNLL
jgi:hypothetical protein